MLSLFETVGRATHLMVFVLGIGALLGMVPLVRARRTGFGLVLMALAMPLMILEPRWQLGMLEATAYFFGGVAALWLLLGPT